MECKLGPVVAPIIRRLILICRFRWVACQLDEIEKCLTPAALRKTLAGLPKTLNETYERILLGINDAYVDQALMILRSIAFSFEPMEVEEVAEIVAMTPEMPDAAPKLDRFNRLFDAANDILSICGSLLQLSRTSRAGNFARLGDESIMAVQLSHYSVKEYLITHGCRFQNGQHYCVTDGLCNTLMAEVCLSYLLDMPPARPSRQTSQADADFSSQVWETGFPLKRYAATYWASHANLAEGHNNSGRLQETVLNFLDEANPAFLRWRRYCEPQPPGRSHIPGTPLYYASGFGLTNSVRQLLASGANVNEATGFYHSAIRAAVVLNREHVVQLLLENGAEPNGMDTDLGKTNAYKPWNVNLLELAIERGYVEIARHLVENGADVNVSPDGEFTTLQLAARHGQPEIMDLLIQHGADISARNHKGNTPLHSAASNVQEEAVKLLLEKGADVSVQNNHGFTALHSACKRCSPETIRLLVESGVDVQAQDEREGRTALQIAAMAGREDIVALLIQGGANISAADLRGRNALHLAALRGHYSAARILIGAGASIEVADGIGRNILDIARQAVPVARHLRRQIPGRSDVTAIQREDEYVIMCHLNEVRRNDLNEERKKLYEFLIQEYAKGRSRVVMDPWKGTCRITRANSVSIPAEDTKRTRTAISIGP
jgi:ankyrin repeat protein